MYPSVDLVYYGNQRQLEYDFVVAPGGNAGDILLDFEGAAEASLARSGDFVMRTGSRELRWRKPVAYQESNGIRQLVACNYVRKGERFAFKLGAYDRSQPLVIDPVLVYSTYLGGTGAAFNESHEGGGETGGGIAVDSSGNA